MIHHYYQIGFRFFSNSFQTLFDRPYIFWQQNLVFKALCTLCKSDRNQLIKSVKYSKILLQTSISILCILDNLITSYISGFLHLKTVRYFIKKQKMIAFASTDKSENSMFYCSVVTYIIY
jgi:hypothetical protein